MPKKENPETEIAGRQECLSITELSIAMTTGENVKDCLISVVIPVRNGGGSLRPCLSALANQTVSVEIIVVDDGSEDRSGELAESLGIKVINQKPEGPAAARNRGTRAAKGRVVLFTDADCKASPDWAATLAAPLLNNQLEGAVGRIDSRQLNPVARLAQLELENRYVRMMLRKQIDFLNTGNCGFQKKLLLEHPFNEKFQWLEDIELSFRVTEAGARLAFVPEARVEHLHPEHIFAYFRRKYHYATMAPAIYRAFPARMFSDAGSSIWRRLQLLLVIALLPVSIWSPGLAIVGGVLIILLSAPLLLRAARESLMLMVVAPIVIIAGSIATAAGILRGLFLQEGASVRESRIKAR